MRKAQTVAAMSDLHLGRDLGYLHSKDPRFPGNRTALLDLLEEVGPQDELILNGDLLELSVAGLDRAYADLREFFVLLSHAPGLKRIVYIPGNHDHHLWRDIAESACVNGQIARGGLPPSDVDYPSFFVDKSFSSLDPDPPGAGVLSELWPKDKPTVEIIVKYPHHLINIPTEEGQARYCLFTHGHFLEDLFTPANYLIEPARLDELEAFNNIWLEAVSYDFGRSGRLTVRVQELLKKAEKRDREARREMKKVLDKAYVSFARRMKLSWPKRLGLCLVKNMAASFINRQVVERGSGLFRSPIDERMKTRVEAYIKKYIIERYRESRAVEYNFPSERDIPLPFTFIFGHTHTPSADESLPFIEIDDQKYPLVNTGGWLRNDGTGAADGENAGLLVIDRTGPRWKSLKGRLQ